MADYHRVLGVAPDASQDAIKHAFRKLALLHHPDRHSGASEAQQAAAASRFKAITEAYDVLTDDRKRAQYEASVRTGGGAAGGSRGGYAYRTRSTVNTDWARSEYTHHNYGSVKLSWFQELQRAVGSRKLEAGFGVAAVGLLLFGGSLVEAVWAARNEGRSFEAMQRRGAFSTADASRASSSAAGASSSLGKEGAAGGGGGGAAAEAEAEGAGGSRRPKPYTPAVGCTNRHSRSLLQQRRPGPPGSQERQLSEMPLAALIAAEEAAEAEEEEEEERHLLYRQQQQHHQQQRQRQPGQQGRQGPQAQGEEACESGEGSGAAGIGGGAQGVEKACSERGAVYVDRAVLIPAPSPPGQMAGHAWGRRHG